MFELVIFLNIYTVGLFNCFLILIYVGAYGLPRWNQLFVDKVTKKNESNETHWYNKHGLHTEYEYIGLLYFVVIIGSAIHIYCFYYAISKSKSSVSAGINKAFQAAGVYILSDILFCSSQKDQCLTLWKSVGVVLVVIGILGYSMGNEFIAWFKHKRNKNNKYRSLNK